MASGSSKKKGKSSKQKMSKGKKPRQMQKLQDKKKKGTLPGTQSRNY